ncbi:MAG: cell wall hydrolase [Clostridiales bacterium]|nr:cell wall hydrolase [Clostridiales bacterium]
MKNLFLSALCAALCLLSCAVSAQAVAPDESNFMEDMIRAACANDLQAGRQAEACRAEKIAQQDLEVAPVAFEDLLLLAKIIQAEAGSAWLSEQWKMSVGEVVLNRVASPEFPNTVREVIEQPGQYYGPSSTFFRNLRPSEEAARLAQRLLEGERVLNEPSVVFQANFPLGGGVFLHLIDSQLGSTYLCYSAHPELYAA